MAGQINQVLQISAVTLLLLTCLLLFRYVRQGKHTWVGIGFTLSVIGYLIIGSEFIQQTWLLFIVALTGAISIPVFFWLLAKAIFDDHFKPTPTIALWFILNISAHGHVYVRDAIQFLPHITQTLYVIGEIISIGFLMAGLYTTLKTKRDDLIESRLRFRNIFIVITAALIGITLLVEATPLAQQAAVQLQILQRSVIGLLTLYFLINNLQLRSGFFFNEYPKSKPEVHEDPLLQARLMEMMESQRIYKKEGLTIGELAKLMNEQEYKLRKLINGRLGFKNFNDFINQYRVKEACEILADQTQNRKTILEIAYALGFQSIGPFNKVFKELKGVTPTAYRRGQQNP